MTLDPSRVEQPRIINPARAAVDEPLIGELFSDLEQNTRLLGTLLNGFPVWTPWIGGNEYLGSSREQRLHFIDIWNTPPTGFYGDGEDLRVEVGPSSQWAAIYPQESTDVWTSWPNVNYPNFVYSCQVQMAASGPGKVVFQMGLLDHIVRAQNPAIGVPMNYMFGWEAFALSIAIGLEFGGNTTEARLLCVSNTYFASSLIWHWRDSNSDIIMPSAGLTNVHELAIEIVNIPKLINYYVDGNRLVTIRSDVDRSLFNNAIWTDTDGPKRLMPAIGLTTTGLDNTTLVAKCTPRAITTSIKES